MHLDIVVWDHKEFAMIVASPLTSVGCKALNRYIISISQDVTLNEEEFIGCCPLTVSPEEFIHHIPKEVGVILYTNGLLLDMRSTTKLPLQ